MGTTTTTNYSLIKPNPGEERDAWGPYLNSNMDTIDTQIKARADAITALQSSKQDADADLTAIAALAGTSGFLTKTGANTWALDTGSYQPLDADLTAIAALAGTSGFLKKTAADTWTLDTSSYSLVGHTHAIADVTGLQTALDGKQPLDAELTAIAALAPTADNFIVGTGSTWTLKTPADARTSLGLGTAATLNAGTGANNVPQLGAAGTLAPVVGGVPTGSLLPYAGSTEPSGWLFCFGQEVSRTTYAALFAALGTVYGVGNGTTTFNLPDLRGRIAAGKDDMGGTSANRLTNQSGGLDGDVLGATGGAETHTMTIAEMPLHGHPTQVAPQSASTASSNTSGGMLLNSATDAAYAAHTGGAGATAGQQVGGTGGGGAHNNIQPTIVLNYIIKV